MSADYVKVAETSAVPVGTMKKAKVGDTELLIANVNGGYYAINNKCPHMGHNLSLGVLEGNVVTCARHKAQFDVTTGKGVSGPKVRPYQLKAEDARSYPLKVENEDIMVKL